MEKQEEVASEEGGQQEVVLFGHVLIVKALDAHNLHIQVPEGVNISFSVTKNHPCADFEESEKTEEKEVRLNLKRKREPEVQQESQSQENKRVR